MTAKFFSHELTAQYDHFKEFYSRDYECTKNGQK